MKNLVLVASLILGIQFQSWADTSHVKTIILDSTIIEIENLPINDTTIVQSGPLQNIKMKIFTSPEKFCADTIDTMEWIFIFCPMILLIFFTITFALGINKDTKNRGFIANLIESSVNEDSYVGPSKFIAFLSGVAATIISLFVLSFYAYMLAAQCENTLDIGELWKLAVALGMGIIPYGYYLFSKRNESPPSGSN